MFERNSLCFFALFLCSAMYVGGPSTSSLSFFIWFSRACRTLALCYSEMHAYIATLSFSYDPSLSHLLFFYLLWVPLSPSLLLSRSLSLVFSFSLLHFIVLFLPYFNEFVADFEASNTDTQPYHIPYQNNNNNHRNTIYLCTYSVWYILKYVYTYTQIDVCIRASGQQQ